MTKDKKPAIPLVVICAGMMLTIPSILFAFAIGILAKGGDTVAFLVLIPFFILWFKMYWGIWKGVSLWRYCLIILSIVFVTVSFMASKTSRTDAGRRPRLRRDPWQK